MVILTHGSDLSLSPTLTPIVRVSGGTVRSALGRIVAAGFHGVQLDATLAGIRPRELDRRARRDLQAMLSRANLRATGLDLFIPRKHFLSEQHVDRAMSTTLAALDLAADLGRLPVSLALPVRRLPGELRDALVEAADGRGVRLAVHAEDQLDALTDWIKQVDLPALGAAIDPAALLARGQDPATVIQRLGAQVAIARLSDVQRGSVEQQDEPEQPTTVGEGGATYAAMRCVVGSGELDVTGYRLAVDLASRRTGPIVLDLRGVSGPLAAATAGHEAWDEAEFSI